MKHLPSIIILLTVLATFMTAGSSQSLSVQPNNFASVNELPNPGYEDESNGKLAAWAPSGLGFALDRQIRHGGKSSIRCESANSSQTYGAEQVLRYEHPDKRPIIVGGWSKTEALGAGGDYCVYLDIIYEDGTPLWGKTSGWSRGTHDWEYSAEIYWPEKPVREVRAYVFLRNTKGTAWFDDVFLYRDGLHVTHPVLASDFPRTTNGQYVRAGLTATADWRCALLDNTGIELDTKSGKGETISWDITGHESTRPARLHIIAKSADGDQTNIFLPVADQSARGPNPVRNGYAVWWGNSMRKVYPTEFPPSSKRSDVSISLARNEREGFQLAITPADDVQLHYVQVLVGKFVNEHGEVFPQAAIDKHLVGYIYVQQPSGHPDAPLKANWCPEALLPLRPFNVVCGRTQTVWINFYASVDMHPGLYRGKVIVHPSGMPATELPVSVRVYGFTLPRVPRMKTAFAMMDGFIRVAYGKLTPAIRRCCMDLMLTHRLNPDDISRTDPPAIDDLLYARDHGMNAFNIVNMVPKPKGNPTWTCYAELADYKPEFTQELATRLDDYMKELRRHGLSKMAYFYGFDERGPEYDDLIKGICKFLKERYPEVSTFTTAGYMYDKRRQTTPGYQDYMDWYCPLTPKYDRDLSQKLRLEHKRIWWYVCCGPGNPYANFASMDYPSIEGRMLGWLTFDYQVDGLLYWLVNDWQEGKLITSADPYLDWKSQNIYGMTGDGCLIYPTPDGPVSSIRLENIRDGLEDYDYLSLLVDLKGRVVAEKFTSRLLKSQTQYSRDPATLYKVRDEIAAQLSSRSK